MIVIFLSASAQRLNEILEEKLYLLIVEKINFR